MPRANTTKTVPFSTFKHPRPAPSPPSHSQSRWGYARSEGSLLRSHGLHVDNGGGFTYDSNAVFRPLKDRDKEKTAVRSEYIGLQRGKLRSWVWSWTSKKWVTLHEDYIAASNSKEDAEYTDALPLNQVHELDLVESKRFCCRIRTPVDTWFLTFSDNAMLQSWSTEIQRRCPLLNISSPTGIRHLLHVTYTDGHVNGLPLSWIKQIGLSHHDSINEPEADIEEAITPMTEPLHSPVQSSSSQSAASSLSPSQQRQQTRQRQQPQGLREPLACSMPTTSAPIPATPDLHKRSPSHVDLNGSTGSRSGSKLKSIPNSEPEPRSPPGMIRTQHHHHSHQNYDQRQRHLSPLPNLTSSVSTSTFAHNSHTHQPEQQQPMYQSNLDARDLTGLVQTVHLLPIAQQDYWDTWKGRWTGQFGTRQVAIHVFRFTNSSDTNNNTPTNQNPSLNNPELVHKFTSILLRELRALHQLRHPNVVRIRGYTRDLFHTGVGGVPAVISTWISDRNIMEYLNDSATVVSPRCRLKWLAEAASGLSYLHTFFYRILHGSLRGSQILIQASDSDREPVALITGFGFNPLLIDEDARWALPNVTPSPRWAAPEVIFGGRKDMTDMADVFSFGRCIVEVLTSQQPYPNIDSDADVLSKIVSCTSTSTSTSSIASVYYPKPRIKPKHQQQHQQQQHRQRVAQTPHDVKTIRALQRLWPLLERCWRLIPTNRPSMQSLRNELLEGIIDDE